MKKKVIKDCVEAMIGYLNRTSSRQLEVWSVRRSLTVNPRLHPVVGQHLLPGQVDVEGEEVVVLAVVDVPLLPGHVSPALPGVHVQPVRGDQTWVQ